MTTQPHTTFKQTSVLPGIEAHLATAEEADDIMNLLLDTALWLQSKGSTQWQQLLEGHDSHDTKNAIRRGEVLAFKSKGRLAAIIILMQTPSPWDLELWGDQDSQLNDAVYLHRLAINREFANKGLGLAILEFVHQSMNFSNKTLLRLDCVANNEKLDKLYLSAGYTFKGRTGNYHKYEKPIQS
jgi:hypothetical protein